jgi:hypothetical protein
MKRMHTHREANHIRFTEFPNKSATGDYPYHDQSTGHGLFRSDDSGTTWYPVNAGLTHLAIWTLEIEPLDPTPLYLGTGGNGVFKGRILE